MSTYEDTKRPWIGGAVENENEVACSFQEPQRRESEGFVEEELRALVETSNGDSQQ
jgi:hypothetical protein